MKVKKESNYRILIRRFVAFIVDLGFAVIVAQIVFTLYSIGNFSFVDDLRRSDLIWILLFLITNINILSMRATPGDTLMRIKIKNVSLDDPSKWKLIVRNTFLIAYLVVASQNVIYLIIMGLLFFSPLLLSLTSNKFQFMHDSLFRTVVIKESMTSERISKFSNRTASFL